MSMDAAGSRLPLSVLPTFCRRASGLVRLGVWSIGIADDCPALGVERELEARAPAGHLALDLPQQPDAVGVRDACRNRPVQTGPDDIAREYDLGCQQHAPPVIER